MKKKIENVTAKLDKAINTLECVMTKSSKVFKEYVKTILAEVVNNEVEVDSERFGYCITYDDGKHSEIQRIYLQDNKVYLETEDAYDLDFDFIDIRDQKTVAECLNTIIEKEYNFE